MPVRYSLGLLTLLILAILVGVAAAKSQPPTSAAPIPTSTATPFPVPPAGEIVITGATGNGQGPQFLSSTGTSTDTMRVGQTVTWVNQDSQAHSVTADNGAFNSNSLDTGQHFSWTARTAGTYPYGDYYDSALRGTLVVKP